MITWIVAVLFIGGLGWSGRRIGALRLAIILVGLIAAAGLGTKLGPSLRPLMLEAAKGNPLIIWVVPNAGVFIAVYVIVLMLAAGVHMKALFYHKYKMPDERRVVWERMNASVGIALGVVAGIAHFIVYGMAVYSLGYWTVQLESAGKNPMPVRLLNTARESLRSSGFERLIAAFDPAPDGFYDAADAVGLIYNNPTVIRRFRDYPGMLSLVERPEFQALLTNAPASSASGAPPPNPAASQSGTEASETRNAAGSPNLEEMLANPLIRAVFKNKEIVTQLSNLDMRDFLDFLKTGKSAKYKDEKVLGRWDLYIPATLIQLKQRHPQIPLVELSRLKSLMNAIMSDVTLVVSPDAQIFVKGSLANASRLTELLSGRLVGAGTNAPGSRILAQGTWKKEGKDYVAVFKGETGDQSEALSMLPNDNLTASFRGEAMVFTKSE